MCTYDVVSWTEWVDLCLVFVGLEALDCDLAGCQQRFLGLKDTPV